jgi:hypothetical protein
MIISATVTKTLVIVSENYFRMLIVRKLARSPGELTHRKSWKIFACAGQEDILAGGFAHRGAPDAGHGRLPARDLHAARLIDIHA